MLRKIDNNIVINNVYFICGFLINLNYILEAIGFEVVGFSFVFVPIVILALLNRGSIYFYSRTHLYLLGLFSTLYLISFLFSDFTSYSIYKTVMFYLKVVPIMLIPLMLKEKQSYFIRGYFFSLAIVAVLFSLYTFANIKNVSLNNRMDIGNIKTIWVSRIYIEFLIVFFFFNYKKRKLLFYIFLIIGLLVVYVSGSKGAILSGLIVFVFYLMRNLSFNKKLSFFLLSFLIVGISLIFISNLPEDAYIKQRFFRIVPDKAGEIHKKNNRLVVWSNVIKKVPDQKLKLLYGEGVGNFNVFFNKDRGTRYYPHNIILELLIENGIFMLIVFLILFYNSLKQKSIFIYLILFYFMNANFSGDIILNERLFLYMSIAFTDSKYKLLYE